MILQGRRNFIIKEEAEDFAKIVNGKVTCGRVPFEHRFHNVWQVWFEYEEEEEKMEEPYSTIPERKQTEDILTIVKRENESLIKQIASLEEELDKQDELIAALKCVNNENQRDIDALRKLQKATVERCKNLERSVSALRKQIVYMKEHGYIRYNF